MAGLNFTTPPTDAAQLVVKNTLNMYRSLATWRGGAQHDEHGLFWIESSLDFPMMNGVRRSLLSEAAADARIREISSHFEQKAVAASWHVWPDDEPSDLGDRLVEAGYTRVDRVPGMIASLSDAPALEAPSGVEASRAGSSELSDLMVPLAACFGLPEAVSAAFLDLFTYPELQHLKHYIARVDGRPVGAATLFSDGESAGIYNVACLPEFRGRGIGSFLTSLAMQDGRAAGYESAVLTSSAEGYRVYQRLGFEKCCTVDIYMVLPA